MGKGDEEDGWLLASSTGETLETQQLDGGFRDYDKEVQFAVYPRSIGDPRGVIGRFGGFNADLIERPGEVWTCDGSEKRI